MAGDVAGTGTDAEKSREDLLEEIAVLTRKIAFLEQKLQLVGSVTRHDVLNQLTAVVGYNELLAMMVTDEKLKGFLLKEKTAIDKIRRQFRFARDYQNMGAEPPRWQNIKNLCTRVSEDFDLKEARILAQTGTASVLADPLLDRVFFHLFENALQHGGTTTEIRVTLTMNGEAATLVVADNGAGIPMEEKEKIFERGYGKGIGWGLFLSREILAITGMTLFETGQPGTGARFEIALPPGSFRLEGGE